jgi:hypothetical protein
MITRIVKRFRWTAAAALACVVVVGILALGCGGVAQAADPNPAASSLVGTWRVEVTLYDCSTFAPQPPFWSLLTFTQGNSARNGTMTETTNNPALVGIRSPAHGSWTSTGPNTYSVVTEAFILEEKVLNPMLTLHVGTQKILQNITQTDANDWTETGANVKFFDASGNNYAAGCANATATRLTDSDTQP